MATVLDTQATEIGLAQNDSLLADELSESQLGLDVESPSLAKPLCFKCGFEVDIFRAHIKNKSKDKPKFICRDCNCISTLLSRRLDISQLRLNELPKEAYQEFWRNCARKRDGEDERLSYAKIRAVVTETCIQQRVKVSSVSVHEDSLPLSVWAQRGFDAAAIEAMAVSEPHPIFGLVYKVPLKRTSREEIARFVQEEIMKAERAVKKQKASSSDQKKEQAAMTDIIDVDEFESDDESAQPVPKSAKTSQSSSAGKRKARNPAKEAAISAKAEARREELLKKKERVEVEKANSKIYVLATKTVGAVVSVLPELESALKNKSELIPQFIVEKLEHCQERLAEFKKQAADRLSKTGKAATKGIELEKLDFSQTDVCDFIKEANLFLGKLKKMQSII